jgi:hypothetical protein
MSTVLLASTCRWFTTARLALAFAARGCSVDVVCPAKHPVERTGATRRMHSFRALDPVRSIYDAIVASRADLIVPTDDLARWSLHRAYEAAARAGAEGAVVCHAIERSLGPSASFAVVESRARLASLAQELGVRVPSTSLSATRSDVLGWTRQNGLPAVLKADLTSGGRGVRFAHTATEAQAAWEALSAPPSPARAIKRALINRDRNYLRPCLARTRSVVSIQPFVAGRDANSTVACWKGQVLGSVSVAVLQTLDQHGPASVVRIIDHPGMAHAVDTIVSHLRLSGLVGVDFLLDDHTGQATLIELNPRATQMGHLALGNGRDPVGSLVAALSGTPHREAEPVTSNDTIALFPQEWQRDPRSAFLRTAYHDVPWDQPSLVRAAIEEPGLRDLLARAHVFMQSLRMPRRANAPRLGHAPINRPEQP